MHLKKWKGIYE